jgi:hypothetical protein
VGKGPAKRTEIHSASGKGNALLRLRCSHDDFTSVDFDYVDQRGFNRDDFASVNSDYI